MKITEDPTIESERYALVMSATEADMLLFALSQCESPAANTTLKTVAKFFGYKVALKEGDVPEVMHVSAAETFVLHLEWIGVIGNHAVDADLMNAYAKVASENVEFRNFMKEDKIIWAIKALRLNSPTYCGLKDAKDMVDMIKRAINYHGFTYAMWDAGIEFKVEA